MVAAKIRNWDEICKGRGFWNKKTNNSFGIKSVFIIFVIGKLNKKMFNI